MKRILLPALCLLSLADLSAQSKSKTKTTDSDKLGEYDNVIIKWKGDKGEKGDKGSKDIKLNIEIKGDRVTVNGKPIDQFENDAVAIIKRNNLVFDADGGRLAITRSPRSPFQGQGMIYNDRQGMFNEDVLKFEGGEERAYLGVASEKTNGGVVITEVTSESGAKKSGLKQGDIITQIDGKAIATPAELSAAIKAHKPNDKITVTYKRNDKEATTTATLGKTGGFRSFNFNFPEYHDNYNFTWGNGQPKIGIRAQDTDDAKGVKVLEVDEESIAEKAGIKEGDIITSLDGTAVNSVNELLDVSKSARDAKKISMPVKFLRDGKEMTADLKVPRKLKTAEL